MRYEYVAIPDEEVPPAAEPLFRHLGKLIVHVGPAAGAAFISLGVILGSPPENI